MKATVKITYITDNYSWMVRLQNLKYSIKFLKIGSFYITGSAIELKGFQKYSHNLINYSLELMYYLAPHTVSLNLF